MTCRIVTYLRLAHTQIQSAGFISHAAWISSAQLRSAQLSSGPLSSAWLSVVSSWLARLGHDLAQTTATCDHTAPICWGVMTLDIIADVQHFTSFLTLISLYFPESTLRRNCSHIISFVLLIYCAKSMLWTSQQELMTLLSAAVTSSQGLTISRAAAMTSPL